ncbi:aromatic ring-hydroxylating oxygenase subunit alpha [Sphingorhabdus sp.]|jgi:phenylpropionate dioxygenase-like ring-hydroxylating dioxygenase large terminal subunit|uniref:aromatic ring-hydroxylating oxygenase subunit alpha n=1 Tax=Sphingorhabdus sp. TaxID=1902408 RepID=UPI003BB039D6|nr:aromatic ring-hydroxylating dioxygenase subunit alpha [Sphingomonadales bacterium]MBK9431003.1 aromatic ring-hydroxylating dioxygenase subunit alpha [Sphingomonadales bacterium]MBL0021143.1 aromatic ring-hydroxylating dioxygenase subunit alpha [Sphingomonadales bacterium]
MTSTTQSQSNPTVGQVSLDGWSLPAWTYSDPEFASLEADRIFRPGWQVVCHESDIPNPGDWHSLDYIGESVIVVRGTDHQLRAFTNVCRHRGSRIVDGSSGCAKKLVCPYHAWTYELDGRLSGVPDSASYPTLDKAKAGLAPVTLETWQGFIFVRLEDGGPSVAEMMAPYEAMIAPFRFPELRALGRVTLRPREVNWKNVGDNYSDGLHIPIAHPGLTRLFGKSYGIEAEPHVDRMWGDLQDSESVNWSERAYQRLLPPVPHLPEDKQRHWFYFKLWPSVAFDIYPDQVDFMQWLPTGPTSCIIREISYVLPDERREMNAARYLNWRINRQVNAEDTALITRVQEGMASRSFSMGPLSDKEVCLKHFCKRIREIIPEARNEQRPAPGWSHI